MSSTVGLVTLNDMKAKQEALVKEREKQLAKKEPSKELQLKLEKLTRRRRRTGFEKSCIRSGKPSRRKPRAKRLKSPLVTGMALDTRTVKMKKGNTRQQFLPKALEILHKDFSELSGATVEQDESNAGKVVLRSWYGRNKHIFPASRWEPYHPEKKWDKYTVRPQRLQHPAERTRPCLAMASLLKVDQEVKLKEPILNIHDLTQIHSDMNLPVPDPILLTNSHDGLDGPTYKKRRLDECEEAFQGTKVFVMPNGMLKSNQQLVDIIEKVKPEIRLLIEKCNTVKMWVQLLIPRIEDGNNFGVSIQEETVAELRTVESEAASYLDQISRYYITRAKLVSKIAKYPHVEDYRRTVTEIDEKEYISLRLIISELRNQYVTLHDMILKNIEKIKRPRSSNAETLY
ncbi:Proteasome activator complex subunit 3 [Microtus ochrogaster]|uniref:Proteasome activator complex subunit 3 n=2 Tax=Boreoeutheria TaxID=1437010 RepID=A0A8J6G4F8_MICOH|nr:Proteasome activator complex subunit 3 [Microtus ochrogaster]